MNTDKLKELIDRILGVEGEIDTQGKLSQLGSALSNVVNQPQNPEHQNALASAFQKFSSSLKEFERSFSPRDYLRVRALSEEAFSPEILGRIEAAMRENAISPNVVNDMVQKLHGKRNEVFTKIKQMKDSLEYFQFGYAEAEEGTAEVGFQIPRAMFNNNLEGLIKELQEIRRTIQFFSEAATGEYHPAIVGSISTTDPLVFLATAMPVAKCFAEAVTWGIGVWYSVEKIRNIRAQTAELQSFSPKEVEDFFDSKIKAEIEKSVEAKVADILKHGKAPKDRHGELKGQLTLALNSLLAKMERGLTIELRLSPPPVKEVGEAEDMEEAEIRQELSDIQESMSFPTPSEDPVLEIPDLNANSNNGK